MRLSCTHASNEAAFNDEAGLELLGLPTAALFVVQTVSVWPRLVHRLHARLRWCAKPRRHMGGAEPALPDGDYEKPEGQDLSQYSRMMAAIHSSHRTGNDIRFVKLPLVLTDRRLYAGAIAQFCCLTTALELALARQVRRREPGARCAPTALPHSRSLATPPEQ